MAAPLPEPATPLNSWHACEHARARVPVIERGIRPHPAGRQGRGGAARRPAPRPRRQAQQPLLLAGRGGGEPSRTPPLAPAPGGAGCAASCCDSRSRTITSLAID